MQCLLERILVDAGFSQRAPHRVAAEGIVERDDEDAGGAFAPKHPMAAARLRGLPSKARHGAQKATPVGLARQHRYVTP